MNKNILLTGGAGYIGSHMAVELLNNNYNVIIVDNLINSDKSVLKNISRITNKSAKFYKIDICDDELETVFKENKIDAVIHFSALKAVGESIEKPELYYKNNIGGLENVLEMMEKYDCNDIVFSSSATVYGKPEYLPIDEQHSLSAINPYGETKIACEEILGALYQENNSYNIAILRYFNPIGAHSSGLIGENPQGLPNNLAPFVGKVAIGEVEKVSVFGDNYDTPDGTGIRDYIHIMDLISGHMQALKNINNLQCDSINLGTGKGYSVLEVIKAFETASGKKIPYEICPPRDGDVAQCYANCDFAKQKLNWQAKYGLDDMVSSHLNWIKK
ncbi:MAG: UDP-glucose 4-epimerase GalE [Alphaproteobacteria bacterium]|jgi:UDP-glucose 4-epimerase|nr:UDP-glucose 4-epimerase GalE [Alphaproteobacteria bacterium]